MRTKKFLSLLLSAAMAFTLLTATAFAAAPAEEENGFFDFLLGKKYTYLYAALTWDEYWANEKVYAAGSTAASAQLDSHEEHDLGAFDAVSRATANHGLHRGSFQSTAVIYAKDGSTYTVSHWSDDGKTIYLADGTTVGWNRGTITKADGSTVQMDHYEVLGTKYVPVRVATSDLADFCSKYTVVENGGQLVGGYSEKNLTAYTLTAAVDKNTNGLKYATKSGDGYTFSAAHTGTGSGVAEAAQKAADGLTVNLRSGSDVGSFGEFIRVDLNGNYGELGSRMQSVVWTYYGNDSTYTHAKASYGTKFAADNWMHKVMGIQLGLTQSARFQLPEGTDGTGYWTLTIRALGYADTVVKFQTTAENLAKHELASDADRAALQAVVTEAQGKAKAAYTADSYANHYGYDADTVTQYKEAWAADSATAELFNFMRYNRVSDNDENYAYISSHIDVDSLIGWTIIQAYCGNMDDNPPNFRMYYSTQDDMSRYALVDLDLGLFKLSNSYDIALYSGYAYSLFPRTLLANAQFRERFLTTLSECLTGEMSNDSANALIDELADELRPEMARECARWGYTVELWERMVDYLHEYINSYGGRARYMAVSLRDYISISDEEWDSYFGSIPKG